MLTRPTASSQNLHHAARLSVAPMMDWTDRHCRYLHRLLCQNALLYTEMVTAPALVRGRALHLLDYHPAEHPVALQLGGSDPAELAEAFARAKAADKTYVIVMDVDAYEGWTTEGHSWWEVGTPQVSAHSSVRDAHEDWESGRKKQRRGV